MVLNVYDLKICNLSINYFVWLLLWYNNNWIYNNYWSIIIFRMQILQNVSFKSEYLNLSEYLENSGNIKKYFRQKLNEHLMTKIYKD